MGILSVMYGTLQLHMMTKILYILFYFICDVWYIAAAYDEINSVHTLFILSVMYGTLQLQ